MKLNTIPLGKVSLTVEGEWDKIKDYDRLSIVSITNYGDIRSYISRKPVPANTEISDTTCWMPIAVNIKPISKSFIDDVCKVAGDLDYIEEWAKD